MKIVALDGKAFNPGDLSWEEFEKLGDFKYYPTSDDSQLVERIGDAEIIFINKCNITKEVIDNCPNLKYIGIFATGYNIVDIDYAREKGIVVTNVPEYSTDSVAQMTFALLLEITNNVGLHNKSVKNMDWCNSDVFSYWKKPLMELSGKTFGIIGYGNIGKKVETIAKAFSMNVIVNSRTYRGENYVTLDELYSKADIISLHCPLTSENEKMINENAISKMKDGVIIINTARGGLIDEFALAKAINEKKVFASCSDVVSVEPIKPENPLLKTENAIITPHIAWVPYETRVRLKNIALKNVTQFLNTEKIDNQVN